MADNTSSPPSFPLHKLVFEDKPKELEHILTSLRDDDGGDDDNDSNNGDERRVRCSATDEQDLYGNTPLLLAASLGRRHCLQVLLKHGK